jgi:para-nitrobenzyl esterase
MPNFKRNIVSWSIAAVCAAGSAGAMAEAYSPARDAVTTAQGVVSAAAESTAGHRVFKAIPFAAPPVGELRWKAPRPAATWTGIRRSDNFSAACMQGNRPFGVPGSILYQQNESQSEDCLYLNVWSGAAAASDKRPVLLLLHGGGFQLGSGSQPNYDGGGLADKGAVVVTMNYRLGPLGFLAHPDLSAESPDKVSGNYALLDAVAALQWVRSNIAAFGGDPSNVTLLSESAGSGLASVLLASPKATGLFQRIVIESLGSLPTDRANPTLAQAEGAGKGYAEKLGARDLPAMRAMSAQQVMEGAGSIPVPIVDGVVWPDQLDVLLKQGKLNDVPMLVGWNADEGTPYPPFAKDLASYEAATAKYGDMAAQFKTAYPVSSDADVKAMAFAPARDSFFGWQPWSLARAHAALGKAKTFVYHFNRHPAYYPDQQFKEQPLAANYGAYHSLEQVYLYNNLDRSAPPRPYTDVDRRLADLASSYLVNFARQGDPNGAGLTVWPAFTGASSPVMSLGDSVGPMPAPSRAAFDFFDAFYASKLGRALPF